MAFRYAHGWDDGTHGGATISSPSGASTTISTTTVRTGSRALQVNANASPGTWRRAIPGAPTTTGWLYFAFRLDKFPTVESAIVLLYDGATVHLQLHLAVNGRFKIKHGNGTTLASGTYIVPVDSFIQGCIEFTIDDSSGVANVYFNGASTADMTFSGDTRNGGDASVDIIQCQSPVWSAGSGNCWFDDVIFQDNAGSAPENSRRGDLVAEPRYFTGDGDATAWSIAGSAPAATRWQSVNEVVSDGDAKAVDSNVVGDEVLFQSPVLSATASAVYAVAPTGYARKLSAGTREIAFTSKLSGSSGTGATLTLTASYALYQDFLHRRPDGTAWAPGDTPQIGAKVIT